MKHQEKRLVYKQLARSIHAKLNCIESGNDEWYDKHSMAIDHIQRNYLPSGSGIDSGCTINNEKYEVLEIESSFHVMDEHGHYDGWVDFIVKVKPSLEFDYYLQITGNFGKHQDLKEYLYQIFDHALTETISDTEIKEIYKG